MIYVNDFFKRNKEAVSNQMELLAKKEKSRIFAATRFMGQRALKATDVKDNIYLLPPLLYRLLLPFVLLIDRGSIHSFEEEPSLWKRLVFNSTGRSLKVSLYRRPTIDHMVHLEKYKYLKRIYVELEYHKEILIDFGFSHRLVSVVPTPAKLERNENKKLFNPEHIVMLFASWNNKEKNALEDRGLLYLINLLIKNTNFYLDVILRDKDTNEFQDIISKNKLSKRVRFIEVLDEYELQNAFQESDFVVFAAQKRIVKDVPNSILDGLSNGKPAILSSVLDFSKIVEKNSIGLIVEPYSEPIKMNMTSELYKELSNKAYKYSAMHTPDSYIYYTNHQEIEL